MNDLKNAIHQGDCLEQMSQLEAGGIDLVFADPPFNIGYQYDVYDDRQTAEDYLKWCRRWIGEIYRVLKPSGTFWLAIGDEFAAELKIEAQRTGFHCRSWVVWYYTFGVNCKNGFSRSHTHLFHLVKDPCDFTFNRMHPRIRVPSARQLVYADARANPEGRLPDNTWITRPQDAPSFLSFHAEHDTWYFARVAGTFKEREGFHGCQMPEQLLARIIRASSNPLDRVLDPFCGSGTTVCVAKKLGRRWLGFELSPEYTQFINQRLEQTRVGDPVDGPEDPMRSAPNTSKGKRRKKPFNRETEEIVIQAYRELGYPADYLLADQDLNRQFINQCQDHGLRGSAYIWNRYLLALRKKGKLPPSKHRSPRITPDELEYFEFASEAAWRILDIDYRKSLDDILCSPHFAAEFDRLAEEFGPPCAAGCYLKYRLASLSLRKRARIARQLAQDEFTSWANKLKRLDRLGIDEPVELSGPGAYVLYCHDEAIYAGHAQDVARRLKLHLANPQWRAWQADSVGLVDIAAPPHKLDGLKAALVMRERPMLNCQLLVDKHNQNGARGGH